MLKTHYLSASVVESNLLLRLLLLLLLMMVMVMVVVVMTMMRMIKVKVDVAYYDGSGSAGSRPSLDYFLSVKKETKLCAGKNYIKRAHHYYQEA